LRYGHATLDPGDRGRHPMTTLCSSTVRQAHAPPLGYHRRPALRSGLLARPVGPRTTKRPGNKAGDSDLSRYARLDRRAPRC
jgi:hypothetical protein